MTVDLAALTKLASEATPGPWLVCSNHSPEHRDHVVADRQPFGGYDIPETIADAAYIAAASPVVVAALVRVALAARRASEFIDHLADYATKNFSHVDCVGEPGLHEPLEIEAAILRAALAELDR